MRVPVKVNHTIESPSDKTLFNRTHTRGIVVLSCPVCGFEFSYVNAVYTLLGGDESSGLYRGSHLVARETPYRRDGLAVRVDGECGHRWDFVFQQHKGQTFIRIDVLASDKSGTGPQRI